MSEEDRYFEFLRRCHDAYLDQQAAQDEDQD